MNCKEFTDKYVTKGFDCSQKRAARVEWVNQVASIGVLMKRKLHRDFVCFYLKVYSPYRHMWE